MKQIFIFFWFSLFGISSIYANTPTPVMPSPESCIPIEYKIMDKNIVLPGPTEKTKLSQVYFLTNQSKQSTFIEHPTGKGASAGWSTYLRSGNWSAIALNKKNFTIHCSMIEPGKVVPLDCSKTITVCQPKKLTTPSNLKGNFWLAEDKDWEAFVKAVKKRGVSF